MHLPPNFSAFHSLGQAVGLAAAEDVRVLGASNYYDFGVYGNFARACAASGVFPLFGLEVVCLVDDLRRLGTRVNDPGNPGKMYLCGKGITRFAPMPPPAAELMGTVRAADSTRMAAMVDKIGRLLAASGTKTAVSPQTVKDAVAQRYGVPVGAVYLQERHVAQAFQEALFRAVPAVELPSLLGRLLRLGTPADLGPASVQAAIRSQLMKAGKPGYVEETFVGFDHAYALVLALGGVPCYPVLADGARPVCEYEEPVGSLVTALKQRRIYCAELIPNRNAPEVLGEYARALRSAGIAVLAGTEHNTPELVPIEPCCAGGAPIPEALKDIFWEGACVVAAHQFLTANGKGGYVGAGGEPDPSYANGEARIRAFAGLGARVIDRYLALAGRDGARAS